ncbi:HIT family protein [Nocardia brasiliensis]|uniref:HIT family protein n=1 Tax=Nocardia brasiliensis TaxID=37326 RepID=UPI002458E122|nr:HIT family protein [Nocardia brasiliensis]
MLKAALLRALLDVTDSLRATLPRATGHFADIYSGRQMGSDSLRTASRRLTASDLSMNSAFEMQHNKYPSKADCIFCKIAADLAPATVLADWPDGMGIKPLNPVSPGHSMAIPKVHVANVGIDPELSGRMFALAMELARGRRDVNLITNCGPEASQTIFHLHVHVSDTLPLPWTGQQKSEPLPKSISGCRGCDIVYGFSPAPDVRVWRDARAIEPLNPVAPGHVMIVPNRHVDDITKHPDLMATMMTRAAELAAGYTNANVITSLSNLTQTVRHPHAHVVPRTSGDGLQLPWTPQLARLESSAATLKPRH